MTSSEKKQVQSTGQQPNRTQTTSSKLSAILRSFALETSTHGFARVVGPISPCARFFWICSLLFAVTLAYLSVKDNISTYFDGASVSKVEYPHDQELTFPAVTVCNINPFRKSLLSLIIPTSDINITSNGSSTQTFEELEASVVEAFAFVEREIVQRRQDFDENLHATDKLWIPSILNYNRLGAQLAGHQRQRLVRNCRFKGLECADEQWEESFSLLHGNCFTFNGNSSNASRVAHPGRTQALELILDAEIEEYIGTANAIHGFVVRIHNQTETPLPEDRGDPIPTGAKTEMALRKFRRVGLGVQRRKLFTIRFGKCVRFQGDDDEEWRMRDSFRGVLYPFPSYSVTSCVYECVQRHMRAQRGCSLVIYPDSPRHERRRESLNFTQNLRCLTEWVQDHQETERMKRACLEECPPLCDYTVYDVRKSQIPWPMGQWYRDVLREKLNFTSNEGLDANLAKILIYLDSSAGTVIEQEPVVRDLSEALSNVGGVLGLWLGMSIFSFLELAQLIVECSKVVCCSFTYSGKKIENGENAGPHKS